MLPLHNMQKVVNALTLKLITLNSFISDAINTTNSPSEFPELDTRLLMVQERKIALGVIDIIQELEAFGNLLEGMNDDEQSPDI